MNKDEAKAIAEFHATIARYDAYNERLSQWQAEVEVKVEAIIERRAIQQESREAQRHVRIFSKVSD